MRDAGNAFANAVWFIVLEAFVFVALYCLFAR